MRSLNGKKTIFEKPLPEAEFLENGTGLYTLVFNGFSYADTLPDLITIETVNDGFRINILNTVKMFIISDLDSAKTISIGVLFSTMDNIKTAIRPMKSRKRMKPITEACDEN